MPLPVLAQHGNSFQPPGSGTWSTAERHWHLARTRYWYRSTGGNFTKKKALETLTRTSLSSGPGASRELVWSRQELGRASLEDLPNPVVGRTVEPRMLDIVDM